jgi:hypothetical membrane protein
MNLKKYLTGNFSKREFTRIYIPIFGIIFISCVFIALLFFPPELNWNPLERTISNLGSQEENPRGWFFISIALMSWGILLIPILLYYHKRLVKLCKHTTRTGTFFGLVGCVFIFLIGIFTDDGAIHVFGTNFGRIHVIVALAGFGGIALAILFYFLPVLIDSFSKRGNKQFPLKLVLPTYLIIHVAGIMVITIEIYKAIEGIGFPGPGLLSIALWEWILLSVLFIYLILTSLYIPEEIKELKERE